MNPPLRESFQSTSRTLDTRAVRMRPRMSKRIVSPTPMLKRSRIPISIETSGSVPGPFQNWPLTTFSFGSSLSR
jgi:hypothetical protein